MTDQAFITCSRKGDWRHSRHADKNGLVQGHAYTITGLYRVGLGGAGTAAGSESAGGGAPMRVWGHVMCVGEGMAHCVDMPRTWI